MPNITETISLLDKLRARATQGRWEDKNRGTVFPIDEPKDDWMVFETYPQSPETEEEERRAINNAEYIVALHNSLPALRQAALDGERYRKAGEAIYKRISSFAVAVDDNEVRKSDCESDYLRGFDFYEAAFSTEAKAIVEAYRQAVEQKEV